FLTAWYGLVELAGLGRGESVMLHAATGGVGMAAVQVARYLGAEVFATASLGKHPVLERMGIDAGHRGDSRDVGFERVLREATGGRGVDVVLNSLAGELTDASLRLVADGGRFIEMGKTDVRDPQVVRSAYPGLGYRAFDLMADAGPDLVATMLGRLMGLFAAGALRPLPVVGYPLGQARRVLRLMSQARHTGKLVLDVPAGLDPQGTVLVTGGTGTLGGLVAEHLVRAWGVRHLLLASRRGEQAPGVQQLVDRLRGLGARVRVVAVDVADPAAVARLVGGVDPGHPLTGVVHAAGVLEDAVLTSQARQGLARVWRAKATAAANLHEATRHLPLATFIMFSSAAATVGSPGQANYAAANAFCDALAAYRRCLGLPGLSIAWGLWADSGGMAGHLHEVDLARMDRAGFTPLSSAQGLTLLDAAGRYGVPHLVAVDLSTRALAAQPLDSRPALLRALATPDGPARPVVASTRRPADLAGQLAGLSPADQHHTLLTLVRTQAATVLGHDDPAAVHPDSTFKELGFDSLTAVELRNRLAAATGLRMPASLVFDYPETAVLVEYLREQLLPEGAAAPLPDPVDPLLSELTRIESTLAALSLDGEARHRVASRLNGLLSKVNGGPAATAGTPHLGLIESASDDEMFELIDRGL
ncbi:MAG TPA: type I polyketide synthase, partial [Micromonosporaceae bacterium]|nr:type I polyketide synthase [Micromonosporaceae bacterium]